MKETKQMQFLIIGIFVNWLLYLHIRLFVLRAYVHVQSQNQSWKMGWNSFWRINDTSLQPWFLQDTQDTDS